MHNLPSTSPVCCIMCCKQFWLVSFKHWSCLFPSRLQISNSFLWKSLLFRDCPVLILVSLPYWMSWRADDDPRPNESTAWDIHSCATLIGKRTIVVSNVFSVQVTNLSSLIQLGKTYCYNLGGNAGREGQILPYWLCLENLWASFLQVVTSNRTAQPRSTEVDPVLKFQLIGFSKLHKYKHLHWKGAALGHRFHWELRHIDLQHAASSPKTIITVVPVV